MKLRAVISGLFIFLVLFSGSSFTIGLHICSGQVQNIALFGKADSCEKEKQLPPCHKHETPACCQDETVVHDSDEFQAGTVQFDFAPLAAIALAQPPLILSEITPSIPIEVQQFYAHDPPLRFGDLTVAFQSFLI